ncbi:MAG: hypothetical protein RLY47_555 [Candidatus Parcubacteria bacterium]|jgi:hypothetical protein
MITSPQKMMETKISSSAGVLHRSRFNKKAILLVIIFAILAGAAFYFFTKYQELKENPDVVNQEEAIDLAAEVGEIMVVPQGEVPTIATVSDPALLVDQPFFKDAKKGDKVLIYSQAGKAILYDPEAKKIIEVAPITNGKATTPEPVPAIETTPEE